MDLQKKEQVIVITIYNNLRNLIQGGYVKNGMPVGNTYTYYITSKGMNWLKEMEEEETEE